jgi:hypothetical protein
MQAMRDVLRGSLGRSLRSLSEGDRLAAAWAVACGPALAERAEVLGLDEDRVLHVRVLQLEWRDQFAQMRTMLTDELRKIAGVKLQTIHFEGQGSTRARGHDPEARGVNGSATRPVARPRRGQKSS